MGEGQYHGAAIGEVLTGYSPTDGEWYEDLRERERERERESNLSPRKGIMQFRDDRSLNLIFNHVKLIFSNDKPNMQKLILNA